MAEPDFSTEVKVSLAEDLSFRDVSALLDEFAASGVFRVRAERVAWSGPAAGGPEVGLILTAAIGAFAAGFCAELAKDTYKQVRGALIALVRKLRDRDDTERRAVVGLAIRTSEVTVCIGPVLSQLTDESAWTDGWLVERLLEAQHLGELASAREDAASPRVGPTWPCEHWLE